VLSDKENTLATPHPKILIAKVREYEYPEVQKEIGELIQLFDEQNNGKIISKLKQMIPEYQSTNLEFQ
jgi:uncharacterized protein YecA (UPF0149 family)